MSDKDTSTSSLTIQRVTTLVSIFSLLGVGGFFGIFQMSKSAMRDDILNSVQEKADKHVQDLNSSFKIKLDQNLEDLKKEQLSYTQNTTKDLMDKNIKIADSSVSVSQQLTTSGGLIKDIIKDYRDLQIASISISDSLKNTRDTLSQTGDTLAKTSELLNNTSNNLDVFSKKTQDRLDAIDQRINATETSITTAEDKMNNSIDTRFGNISNVYSTKEELQSAKTSLENLRNQNKKDIEELQKDYKALKDQLPKKQNSESRSNTN